MRALVYHGPRDVSVKSVPDPKISQTADIGREQSLRGSFRMNRRSPKRPTPTSIFDARDNGWTKVVLNPDLALAEAQGDSSGADLRLAREG